MLPNPSLFAYLGPIRPSTSVGLLLSPPVAEGLKSPLDPAVYPCLEIYPVAFHHSEAQWSFGFIGAVNYPNFNLCESVFGFLLRARPHITRSGGLPVL